MHYYQFNIKDFNNYTRHLNRLERSVYRDLLDYYYDSEKPITGDLNKVCRRVLAQNPEEMTAVENILKEYFDFDGENYVNPRADKEIALFLKKSKQSIAAGKASGKARRAKACERTLSKRSTDVEQTLNQPITNNHKPLTNNHKDQEILPPQKSGVEKLKISPTAVIDLFNNHFKNTNAIHKRIITDNTKQQIRNITKKHLPEKKDWVKFFEYIELSDFLMGLVEPNGNYKQFKLKIDWIAKPANFVKIMEHQYHGD